MPIKVQELLDGRSAPVTVLKSDPVSIALALMVEHDVMQLPVVTRDGSAEYPLGKMVAYEGIVRALRTLKVGLEALTVREVMTTAPTFYQEDDLFDLLDLLTTAHAALIVDSSDGRLVGILTQNDTTAYFRSRTEDLLRVEDIETTVRELARIPYTLPNGEVQARKLQAAVNEVAYPKPKAGTDKPFNKLSFAEYNRLLTLEATWPALEPIFKQSREAVFDLLDSVRELRNRLAHYHGDLTAQDRELLLYCADWLANCQSDYQEQRDGSMAVNTGISEGRETPDKPESGILLSPLQPDRILAEISVPESGSRYGRLADWLESQPGNAKLVQLTFSEIEAILDGPLPPSARNHRAWWANDNTSHVQAQQWLAAGWRATYINLNEERISFARIRERERAYIAFFAALLNELRAAKAFTAKDVSPDGTSWMVIDAIRAKNAEDMMFSFSFTRDKRLRAELYIDLGQTETTKQVFDLLFAQRDAIEARTGPLTWERLDHRRASRIAHYMRGHILAEPGELAALRTRAVQAMIDLRSGIIEPATDAGRHVAASA